MHDDLGSVSWWPICLWSTHLRLSPAVSLSMMFWHFLKLIFMYGCCREHLPAFTILMYAALISLTESPGDSWTAARCTFGKHELAGRGIASGVRLHLQSSFIQRRGWNEIRLDAVHSVVKGHHRPHVAPFSISPATNRHATIHILVALFSSVQSGRSETFRWVWDDTQWECSKYKEEGIEAVIRVKRSQRGFTAEIIKPVSINVTLSSGTMNERGRGWGQAAIMKGSFCNIELILVWRRHSQSVGMIYISYQVINIWK